MNNEDFKDFLKALAWAIPVSLIFYGAIAFLFVTL